MKHTTKWIALFVCLAMLVGSVPVFAVTGADMSAILKNSDVSLMDDGDYYFHDVQDTQNPIIVMNNKTVNITVENLSTKSMRDMTAPLIIGDNCNVTLTVLGTVDWEAGSGYSGIVVPESSTLTITGDGTLTIKGGDHGAGIGGYGDGNHAGTIIIGGAVAVNATGGYNGAGIGGGDSTNGGSVLIKDSAVVHAEGRMPAAGIGGGSYGGNSDITITGSATVYSSGYWGLGSGMGSSNFGTLTIDKTATVIAASSGDYEIYASNATLEGDATVFGVCWGGNQPRTAIKVNFGDGQVIVPEEYGHAYAFMVSLPTEPEFVTLQSDTNVYGHDGDASDIVFDTTSNNIKYRVTKGAAIASTTPPTLDLVVEEQPDGSCKLVFDVGEDNLANMSAFYYSLDGESFQKADGNKADIASDFAGNVTVYASDIYGNMTKKTAKVDASDRVTGGNTSSANADGWYNEDVKISVESRDGGSGLREVTYTTNEAAPQSGSVALTGDKGTVTLTNEGIYDVTITALDYAGNTSIKTLPVKLDKTPPTIDDVQFAKAGPLTRAFNAGSFNERVEVTVVANDNLSGVKQLGYKLDTDSDYTYTPGNAFMLDREYSGTLQIIAIDYADNVSEVYSTEIVIDATSPELSIAVPDNIQPSQGDWYNAENFAVSVTASDADGIASVTYTTDEAEPQTGSVTLTDGTGTITGLHEGNYNLTVTATDNSGNTTQQTLAIKLDRTLPVIEDWWLDPMPQSNYMQVTVEATDENSGIAEIRYQTNEMDNYGVATPNGVTNEYVFGLYEAYQGTVSLWAVDNAGNVTFLQGGEITVDTTPPAIDVVYSQEPNEFGWNNEDITLTVTVKDEGISQGLSEVTYTTNEDTPLSGTLEKTSATEASGEIVLTNEGVYDLTIKAIDVFGYVTETTLHIKLDKAAPFLSITVDVVANGIEVTTDENLIMQAVDLSQEIAGDADSVNLTLQVDKTTAQNLPEADVAQIQAHVNQKQDTVSYLDIGLSKTVEYEGARVEESSVTETTKQIPITVELPDELLGKDEYQVVRVHDGVAEVLPCTVEDGKLTFATDRFSSYAIIGTDEPEQNHTGSGSGGARPTQKPTPTPTVTLSPTPAIVTAQAGEKAAAAAGSHEGWTEDCFIVPRASDGTIAPISTYADGELHFIAPIDSTYTATYNYREFADIAGHWAEHDIHRVAARELYQGIDTGVFAPDAAMTRAMYVTVLARLESADLSTYHGVSAFADVDDGAWYAAAVAWAADNAITEGVGDNLFEPDAPITREQIATMLLRYANEKGISAQQQAQSFADADSISDWAREAVSMARALGVVEGKEDNRFDPQASATRAEVAAMFMRLVGVMVEG